MKTHHGGTHRRWIWFLPAAGLLLPAPAPAESTRVTLTGVWLDGVKADYAGGELCIPETGTLQLAACCQPPRFDALYTIRTEGSGTWSTPGSESTFRIDSPRPGTHMVRIAARSAQDAWSADTLALVVRVAGPQAARGSGGVSPLLALPFIVLLGLAGGIVFLLARRRSRPEPDRAAPPARPATGVQLVPPAPAAAGGPPRFPDPIPFPGTAAVAGPASTAAARPASTAAAGAPAHATGRPGPEIPVEDSMQELAQLRGRILELLNVTRSLRKMNRELKEKCEFLEKANLELRGLQRRKEEALAAIAHDIKNPAAAIQTLGEVLQSYDLNSQQQAQFVTDIIATSSKILKLSQELSSAMVSEVKDVPLQLEIAPLRDVLDRACKVNQVLAERKRIRIQALLPEKLPSIEMDADRIEEALDNLLSNAIKYSPAGSTVALEARITGANVTIDVIDSGAGLSQTDLQNVFQFGKTLSNKPTGGEGSSGLGLWIVRKIVEAHNGFVYVRSAPGAGTTFSMMLPLRAGPLPVEGAARQKQG